MGRVKVSCTRRMDIQLSDFLTVGLLVVLEGLLSADNALVVAVMILGLPAAEQKNALRYGLIGAFVFRTIATLLAVYLIQLAWVKLLGGALPAVSDLPALLPQRRRPKSAASRRPARPWLGLSALWATILKVELVNIAFSVDSILVAVAMSPKTWVVLTGGLLGIVAMRVVISQLLVDRPALPGARRRRLRHHRARRRQAPDGVRRWRWTGPTSRCRSGCRLA